MVSTYKVGLLCCLLVLAGCASLPPAKTDNLCDIFSHKKSWYEDAKKASKRWQVPIPVLMSFIYQESRFEAKAKPPRGKFLWVFPGRRPSSAYGYAQAKDSTWKWYKESTGRRYAGRADFTDAVDFVAWYNHQSKVKNKIASGDAYRLYLAYHEGHGGYSRKTYAQKTWLLAVAKKVAQRSASYSAQLASCEKKLNKGWWIF